MSNRYAQQGRAAPPADAVRLREVAVAYHEIRDALYRDLHAEFAKDLPRWKAELIKSDLSLRFDDPHVPNADGESELTPEFRQILTDFFPRYEKILASPKYRNAINEVRIQGHGSSPDPGRSWNGLLSRARTRAVLDLLSVLPQSAFDRAWLNRHVTANGPFSPPIGDAQADDLAGSSQVVFRVRTDAETRVERILEASR